MGCSASKLEEEEAVKLCRERRNFIKQAVEQRYRFAAGHVAYLNSLRRVAASFRSYVEGDQQRRRDMLFLDSLSAPHFVPAKKAMEIGGGGFKSISPPERKKIHVMRYLKPSANHSVSVEEWPPQSPETARIESCYFTDGGGGFFAQQQQSTPMQPSSYYTSSSPPQQWDSFWNPFSAWDSSGYPGRSSFDRRIVDDDEDAEELRQVREEEGIPELEEDVEGEEEDHSLPPPRRTECNNLKDENFESDTEASSSEEDSVQEEEPPLAQEMKEHRPHGSRRSVVEVSAAADREVAGNVRDDDITAQQSREAAADVGRRQGTPGFTVYVNRDRRRPASLLEVVQSVEGQFLRICDAASGDVSVLLETCKAQYSLSSPSSSSERAVRLLNPVALIRSGSSRTPSSRFLQAPSSAGGGGGYQSGSDCSSEKEEECSAASGCSHQATLDRLHAWEKKLYEEVKSGEKTRLAYEKKVAQLRSQDVNGEEPAAVDRTRAALRDLHTRLKVSMHSVQSVSTRIETLRDQELHSQILLLIQGLARMWRVMADCHQIQKHMIDEAKLLILANAAAGDNAAAMARPSLSAVAALQAELRQWRACLDSWIASQRSYARSVSGWIRRCGGGQAAAIPSFTDRCPPPPVYWLCVGWSRFLDSINEAQVVDGMDFFLAGIASVASAAAAAGAEAAMSVDIAERIVWAGMSAAVGSLAEFAAGSAEGYEVLLQGCLAGRGGDAGGEGEAGE